MVQPTMFGTFLRTLREDHGWSLQEAAENIGCTKTHIYALERGTSVNPTIKTLAQVACAYDADLETLALMAAACCPGSGYRSEPAPNPSLNLTMKERELV